MARYFFDVRDGLDRVDREGTELSSLDAARAAALQLVGNLLIREAKRSELGSDWYLEVADETGLILFRLDLHLTESPAVKRYRSVEDRLS